MGQNAGRHQFTRLHTTPAYQKVQQAIQDDILSGKLADDDLLPTENELCEQFGVTRSTVREGIRMLENSGLIFRGAGKRLIIRRPQSTDIANTTSRALTFSGVTFREAWEALALFQPQVAAMACGTLSNKQIKKLKSINKKMDTTHKSDHEEIIQLTDLFFHTLAEGYNNKITLSLLQSLNKLTEAGLRKVIVNTPDARKRIVKAQRELIDAIDNNDASKARKWMRRHIDDLQRACTIAGISMDKKIL